MHYLHKSTNKIREMRVQKLNVLLPEQFKKRKILGKKAMKEFFNYFGAVLNFCFFPYNLIH